jgi:cell wall-associated NlpC family hydrolase
VQLRARTLVVLGLMMFAVTWVPAASAAVTGGAGLTSGTTRAPKGKQAKKAKKKKARRTSPAKVPQGQESQQEPSQQAGSAGGGAGFGYVPPPETRPTVPGARAVFRDGIAYAPAAAPLEVQQAVWAANDLLDKPYVYGGGHKSFRAAGYDCSGTVSYALNGAGLLDVPLDSSSFMSWGAAGKGTWITVYTNPGHAFVVIAGLRLDTSGPGEKGPRWRPGSYSTTGFKVRHPENY